MALWNIVAVALVGYCQGRRTFGVSWKQHQADGSLWPSGEEILAFNHSCEARPSDPQLCIMQHFWAGGSFHGYEDSVLRYYVDGEDEASVVIPFSLGLGSDMIGSNSPWSAGALFGKTGEPSGIFHNYHVPFARSVSVTVQLGGSGKQQFWIILKGTVGMLPRVAGEALPLAARARTFWQRPAVLASSQRLALVESSPGQEGAVLMTGLFVNWTDPGTDLPCSSQLVGDGLDMYGGDLGGPIFAASPDACAEQCCEQESCVGFVFEKETDVQTSLCSKGQPCCFLKKDWKDTRAKSIASAYRVMRGGAKSEGKNMKSFLEGCVRGENAEGQLRDTLSSGTEDYFLGTYYFNRGQYTNPVAGLTDLNNDKHTFSAYRIHDADPLFFDDGFRLTWRNSDPYGVCDLEESNGDAHAVTASSFALMYEWPSSSATLV